MPQALSKFKQPLNRSVSKPTDKEQKKRPILSRWKKFRYRRRAHKKSIPPINSIAPRLPSTEVEDWEKEIEEFSRSLEKEKDMKSQTAYGPEEEEEELNIAVSDMTLYNVPGAPTLNQEHYSPSTHHVPPMKWVRYIYSREVGQFADAEE